MARFEIRIADRAAAEIRNVSRWWRKHRLASPLLFDHELDTLLELLEVQPAIGTVKRLRGVGEVRVVVLVRSRYLVAYQIMPEDHQVWLVRVRHASRSPVLRAR